MYRGWKYILPGWRRLYVQAPANQQPASCVGVSIHTVQGGVDPGEVRFRPRAAGVVDIWNDV